MSASPVAIKASPIAAIITNFRHGPFLAEAVASVFAQTLPVDRVILVDDASGPEEERFLRALDPRVEILRLSENTGPGGARQAGSDFSGCDLVAYLDADDLWMPTKIERQYAHLIASDGASGSHTGASVWRADGSERHFVDTKPLELELHQQLQRNQVAPPTVMLWRKALDMVGGWSTRRDIVQDWDLFIRMAAAGHRIVGLRESLTRVRRHGHSHLSSSGLRQIRRLLATVDTHAELIMATLGHGAVRGLERRQLLSHRYGLPVVDRLRVLAAAGAAGVLPRPAWSWLI